MGRVWRSAGGEFWMTGLQPTVNMLQWGLIVKWGAIWHDGKCELMVCVGGINSAKYMQILKKAHSPIQRKWHTETLVSGQVSHQIQTQLNICGTSLIMHT